MKKNYLVLLIFLLTTTVYFAQEQYNIKVESQLNFNENNKNTSFLIVEKKNDKITIISAEALGIPLKGENNIQLIVSDLISKELSSIEVIDNDDKSFYLNLSNKSIDSKIKWKEIKFYDNSNKLIGIVSFDLFF